MNSKNSNWFKQIERDLKEENTEIAEITNKIVRIRYLFHTIKINKNTESKDIHQTVRNSTISNACFP